ncbi:hypothetical protein LEP1GSC047_2418 [Leptospira inadai serovar Lyme str. 10]|uniref:Uncharacterized protein n=2 Tax=Leptospira inadai serovar Lyme TaxID=293084 RepID=V6HFJ2_9LEPT|nr:hypothetical protein LEP1GSC047_2418 [Leptospira inadai serovar Lyme str. 10]PNV75238.1 hypothetical protein BES34_010175 [Leptospira inadai serovar Lyme]
MHLIRLQIGGGSCFGNSITKDALFTQPFLTKFFGKMVRKKKTRKLLRDIPRMLGEKPRLRWN